ncbi:insulin gene enhancer protein ISL-1 [Strongylocentrotus purpuratus]|uniref:Insulin gene enhancer protein ISL-1 n=1 Tax=Strongylocentrotus purpuratus TaxID=7668 RepID=A0A7M7RF13_STRPU|nr:insulin gene enhancer protein ISL-1 [Strongylocentrotus purpuratus]|eukprot:XP_781774.3 PREDICTED: insulin gene enhancer protein ISL-1 [Strongylocentrotus purpuratus]
MLIHSLSPPVAHPSKLDSGNTISSLDLRRFLPFDAMEEITKLSCKRRASLCVGCGGSIQDQYILRVAPDLEWHAACLKCADCCTYLDETCTCFVRDGKPYCKRDYLRLFGTKCAKCSQGFTKNDFVMRARNKIYHIDCFRCVACSRQLIPGDEFALREDGLFCKADHEVMERPGDRDQVPNVNHRNYINATRAEPMPNRTSSGRSHVHKQEKPTRVRTVLNEKQLHTLRTCYAANPRPDALMKEQLVEMTQLSPRVIRVWFQNKRCKDKKRTVLMKQIADQQASKDPNRRVQSFNGVPMVASSPVRHDSQMPQGSQVEVQSYQQPPWKALSDFALQSDIEQPPFQQLVNFSEQSLGQTTLVKDIPPRDDAAPGSGMSLPPTPDSSDRMHSSHLDLEPLSASD